MTTGEHWQRVYTEKSAEGVSWFQAVPALSLRLIGAALDRRASSPAPARFIDMGGGASTLADHLLERGAIDISVLDIAAAALDAAKARLGPSAAKVRWVVADALGPLSEITDGSIDIWHDRAMFHFLTERADRAAYARNLERILAPGGTAIIAAFAPSGPEACSNLPVMRHDGASIVREVSAAAETPRAWVLSAEHTETHTTPWGKPQEFVYAVLNRHGT